MFEAISSNSTGGLNISKELSKLKKVFELYKEFEEFLNCLGSEI